MLELLFSFCISKKPSEILIFKTFIAKFWMFAYFLQKITIFRSSMFLWCHNYVTPWPIVLILVCMSREGPYLPIDTKINFIGGSVQQPPLVRRVTKKSLVRRGLILNLLMFWWVFLLIIIKNSNANLIISFESTISHFINHLRKHSVPTPNQYFTIKKPSV